MKKRTREIVALILLLILGLGAVCAMCWYILAAHAFNITASNIDDSIGQMDAYTVFIFEGTRDKKAIQEKLSTADNLSSKSEFADETETEASVTDRSNETSNASISEETADALKQSDQASGDTSIAYSDTANDATVETTEDEPLINTSMDARVDAQAENFTLEALALSYLEKGATVFQIKLDQKSMYEDLFFSSKDGVRVGIYSLAKPSRTAEAQIFEKLLKKQGAAITVGIVSDTTLDFSLFNSTTFVIRDLIDENPEGGQYINSVYCVDTPYIGEIEAVIISPSGVISCKTISSS